nr:hypothetical protein [Brevibacillus laterosporus]
MKRNWRVTNLNKVDIAKAQELWKTGLHELGTKQVSLEFLTYDSPLSKKLAEYMKNQL